MLWCGIGNTQDDKVKMFVDYFNNTYKGEYPPVKTNTVNNAKNTFLHKPEDSNLNNNLFHAKIDALVKHHAANF